MHSGVILFARILYSQYCLFCTRTIFSGISPSIQGVERNYREDYGYSSRMELSSLISLPGFGKITLVLWTELSSATSLPGFGKILWFYKRNSVPLPHFPAPIRTTSSMNRTQFRFLSSWLQQNPLASWTEVLLPLSLATARSSASRTELNSAHTFSYLEPDITNYISFRVLYFKYIAEQNFEGLSKFFEKLQIEEKNRIRSAFINYADRSIELEI